MNQRILGGGKLILAWATVVMVAGLPAVASACAVCYGEPDSPASRGLTWAIVALGSVVVCVLAGVVGFFVQSNRKAAGLSSEESGRVAE